MTVLRCSDLVVEVPGRCLLDGIDLEVAPGSSMAIVGPSGSGKSTLLNVMAGVVPTTSGRVEIAGTDIASLRGARRARFRLDHIGIVFQFGELLPEFTVAENVALPLRFRGCDRHGALASAADALGRVGLAERADAAPDVLSGGERQRVAVARALAGHPRVLIADEPTGSLDRLNADRVARLLVDEADSTNAALVIATHDPLVARACERVVELSDGALIDRSAGS